MVASLAPVSMQLHADLGVDKSLLLASASSRFLFSLADDARHDEHFLAGAEEGSSKRVMNPIVLPLMQLIQKITRGFLGGVASANLSCLPDFASSRLFSL